MATTGAQVKASTPRTGEVHPKNQLNELSGGQWLYFTKSVITTAYARELGHDLRKRHGANKPPQLMRELIEFFTTGDGLVLDPFAGVGGTLLGASLADPPRSAIGIEINRTWIDLYHEVCEREDVARQVMIAGDCLSALRDRPAECIDFIATDPPYNTHLNRTMCNGRYDSFANRRTDYDMSSDLPGDLANLPSFEAYLDAMEVVLGECYRVLKQGKYMALIVRNAYQEGSYIFTHVRLADRACARGFIVKGEKVWYQAGTRLRPYGYPFAYVPNIAHQHIVILQKPKPKRKAGRKRAQS